MPDILKNDLPLFVFRPKLLVVDDQALNIRLLHELFREDFDVYMATDGLQAISKAQDLAPDLILLDVVMPGMDGFEVCLRLKEDPKTNHIPVIFITSHFDEADEVRGFELGGSDFIHKPINPVITHARVNTHLKLKRQADKLRDIALIDGLTGVANRRKFDLEISAAWRTCQRNQTPLSLLMLDVDYFKRFNDLYGHQLGDSCLQWVARAIRRPLQRPKDLVARYGGEEFTCILPDTDADGARFIAQQLLDAVAALKLEHADSEVSHLVTISIGAATQLPNLQANPEALIEAADQQLYRAKEEGRARVCCIDMDDKQGGASATE